MKKKISTLLVFTFLIALLSNAFVFATPQSELIVNGDFANGSNGWTIVKTLGADKDGTLVLKVDNTTKNGGNNSLQMSITGSAGKSNLPALALFQDANGLEIGATYNLNFYVHNNGWSAETTASPLTVKLDDASGALLTGGWIGGGLTDGFTAKSIQFTATKTNHRIFFTLWDVAGNGDATYWLDDITLVKDGTTTNLLANGDFEANNIFPKGWSAWTNGNDIVAGISDNGGNSAQCFYANNYASTDAELSLYQEVTGITPGKKYDVKADIIKKDNCMYQLTAIAYDASGNKIGDTFVNVDPAIDVTNRPGWTTLDTWDSCPRTLSFTAPAGTTKVRIEINAFISGGEITVDNVSLKQQEDAPSSTSTSTLSSSSSSSNSTISNSSNSNSTPTISNSTPSTSDSPNTGDNVQIFALLILIVFVPSVILVIFNKKKATSNN